MNKLDVMSLATNLDLEAERKRAAESSKVARVKIPKGHAWLIRLLPFAQGSAKEVFVRLAQHWFGKRSVPCRARTSPNLGGDPSYDCPICAAAASGKNEALDDDERDDYYKVEARESYRCYCLVLKREDDRGGTQETVGEDIFTPHEFNIPKSSFANLAATIERSKSRKGGSGLGLLDLETGTDLWASRDSKNSLQFQLSAEGPLPIFELNEEFDSKIARVWKQLRQPSVKFLTPDREDALADMIAEKSFEQAAKMANERNGPRGRFHEADQEDPPVRGRFSGVEEDGGGDQEEPPARGRGGPARSASPARNGFDRAKAAIEGPAQTEAQVSNAASAETERETQIDEPAHEETPPAVSTRRESAGSAIRPAAAPYRVPVPPSVVARRRVGAAPPPSAAKSGQGGRIEDETSAEDLPEEASDPVPAADAELAPAEAKSASPARGALHSETGRSIVNMSRRGR